jgi:hypothetical protein
MTKKSQKVLRFSFVLTQVLLILIPIGMLLTCGYYINEWYERVDPFVKQAEDFPTWLETGGLFLGFYAPFVGAGLAYLFAPEPIEQPALAAQGRVMAYLRDFVAVLLFLLLLGIPAYALKRGDEVPDVSRGLMPFLPIAEGYLAIMVYYYFRQKLHQPPPSPKPDAHQTSDRQPELSTAG